MFLQFAIPGSFLPMYSIRLKELSFSPMEMAICCATHGIGALLAPLGAQLADRYFAAEKCVSVFCFLGSILLVALSNATGFWAMALLTLVFWLLIVPMMVLCSTICFTHLQNPEKQFGFVRFKCRGCVFGLIVTIYAFTLPHTPPRPNKQEKFAPLAAMRLLKGWPFATYCLCTLGVCITMPFTTQASPLLLEHLGIVQPWLSPTLTISQVSEVISLFMLPMFLIRLGLRGSMVFGLICWLAALCILAVGEPAWLVI
ncbi:hypothetical protein EBX93_19050, partial [bacterium]|nr:hypothetical protein [bacterium]